MPELRAERDSWVVSLRGARTPVDPWRPYGFSVERERSASGVMVDVATLLLTNRECPWRCVMCDLWKNTLERSVEAGMIPAQIDYALARLRAARQIKLYNSGSFFDTRAIPPEDDAATAERVRGFERVIVESHPSLVGERCFRFRDRLAGQLEVAMGLETAHPEALAKLNKGVTLEGFRAAAERLRAGGVALRVFVLVGVPFVAAGEQMDWVGRSVEFAWECGATAVSLIATRGGNGAMESLEAAGEFGPPTLDALEAASAAALNGACGRVFADLWDARGLARCAACAEARLERLQWMNDTQQWAPQVACAVCGGAS